MEHGEWQDWLIENVDLSIRTAQNYLNAAEYVESKSETVADFTALSPTLLYQLAAGIYSAEEEAAILAATRKSRVGQTLAATICLQLRPPEPEPEPEVPDEISEAAEDAEIAAILDGAPPDVPQPAASAPPDYAVQQFNQAISALRQIMTKPPARFAASTVHTVSDLQAVESFIHAVAEERLREARSLATRLRGSESAESAR